MSTLLISYTHFITSTLSFLEIDPFEPSRFLKELTKFHSDNVKIQ